MTLLTFINEILKILFYHMKEYGSWKTFYQDLDKSVRCTLGPSPCNNNCLTSCPISVQNNCPKLRIQLLDKILDKMKKKFTSALDNILDKNRIKLKIKQVYFSLFLGLILWKQYKFQTKYFGQNGNKIMNANFFSFFANNVSRA